MNMLDIKTVFGQNVQKYRKQFNLTQEKLAEKINISQTFLANIERGKRGVSLETVEELSKCFGVTYSALFEEKNKEETEKQPQKTEKLFYHNLEQKIKTDLENALHKSITEVETCFNS